MSKGHGLVQQVILGLFEASPEGMPNSIEICARALGREMVTLSEAASFRRALRRLAAEGRIVDMGRGWRDGRRRYALPDQAARENERVEAVFGPLRRRKAER
jgi:hypothetical protein